jgi:hypothetical protein
MESTVAIPRDWEVCGTCHELRGPFGGRVQQCRCERPAPGDPERAETWPGFDFNKFAELCRMCGCDVLRSGSRYSVWLCPVCKARALERRAESGRSVVPIGRYFVLPVTTRTSGRTAEAIADRIIEIGATQRRLADWAHIVVGSNLATIGRADAGSVPLQEYLDGVRDVDRGHAFDGAVQWVAGQPT